MTSSDTLSVTLKTDWFGAPVSAAPRCELRLENGAIHLRAGAAKAPRVVAADTGGYVAGLWEGDCAELFLVNPQTGYYIEINLSPRGGWWSCEFTAPRVRAPGAPRAPAGVITRANLARAAWEAAITIPVASLPKELDFDPAVTRGNITFCLGDTPQLYLTHADLGGGTPDFHRPDRWIRLFE